MSEPDNLSKFYWGVGNPKKNGVEWLPKSGGHTNRTGKIDQHGRTQWANCGDESGWSPNVGDFKKLEMMEMKGNVHAGFDRLITYSSICRS